MMKKKAGLIALMSAGTLLLGAVPAMAATFPDNVSATVSPTSISGGTTFTVSGTVTDSSGQPVDGATSGDTVNIFTSPNNSNGTGWSIDSNGQFSANLPVSSSPTEGPNTITITVVNPQGQTLAQTTVQATFTPWPPASNTITAPGFNSTYSKVFVNVSNFKDASGVTIANAEPFSISLSSNCFPTTNETANGSSGSFEIPLSSSVTSGESCTVSDSYNGTTLGTTTFTAPTAPAPTPTNSYQLTLDAAPTSVTAGQKVTLSGVLTDNGSGVGNTAILIMSPHGNNLYGQAITDTNGKFTFSTNSLPTGSDGIVAQTAVNGNTLSSAPITITVANATPAPQPQPQPQPIYIPPHVTTLTLSPLPSGTIYQGQTLTFTGSTVMNNGQPGAGTSVWYEIDDGQPQTVPVDHSGNFQFSITPQTAGPVTLTVGDGTASKQLQFTVTALTPNEISLTVPKEIAINGTAQIAGKVMDNNGQPAPAGQAVNIHVGQSQFTVDTSSGGIFTAGVDFNKSGQIAVSASAGSVSANGMVDVTPPVVHPQPHKQPVVHRHITKHTQHHVLRYVVREGNTLWTLAERFYHNPWDFGRIVKANGLKSPHWIFPGEVLQIPGVK